MQLMHCQTMALSVFICTSWLFLSEEEPDAIDASLNYGSVGVSVYFVALFVRRSQMQFIHC